MPWSAQSPGVSEPGRQQRRGARAGSSPDHDRPRDVPHRVRAAARMPIKPMRRIMLPGNKGPALGGPRPVGGPSGGLTIGRAQAAWQYRQRAWRRAPRYPSPEAPAGSWGTAKRGHGCRTAMLLSPSARERLPARAFDQAPQREKPPAQWRRSRSPGPARGRGLLGHPRGGSPAQPTPPVPLAGDSAGRVPVSLACQLRAIAPCVHRGGTCSNRPTRGASETVVLTPGGVLTRDSESFGARLSGSE
jgi:hypothetical protein